MSLLPFLALYIAIVFAPLYVAVRDLMVHQIRIERARATRSLATRDRIQLSAPNASGRLQGNPRVMEAQVREVWAGARILGPVLESMACQPWPSRCTARATVVTRGLLGMLRARLEGDAIALEGIEREGE